MRALARVAVVLAPPAAFAALAGACGEDHVPATRASDAAVDHVSAAPTADAYVVPPPIDASFDVPPGEGGSACNVRLDMPPLLDSPHVPEGTVITYDSNPPSSGPHYPIWANFQEFDKPVDDGYLVHSEEHGGVLLLYSCTDAAGGACNSMVSALRAVRDAVPTDPTCDPSIRVRIIIAPRPANDAPVAAAAWGNTYKADCVDPPSLAQFVADHYAKAPENFCSAGMTF
jgi:hypothetical protein